MSYHRFVEAGRLVYLGDGPDKGKLAVIVDILSTAAVLIDGPTTGVKRQVVSLRWTMLTDQVINISEKPTTEQLKKEIEASPAIDTFMNSVWGKKIQQQRLRAKATFEDMGKIAKLRRERKMAMRRIAASMK